VVTQMIEFDKALRGKGDEVLDEMWCIVSAVGSWLNCDEYISALIGMSRGFRITLVGILH
jgi:hypothetical protein